MTTETTTAPARTTAQVAKFKIEFMMLMLISGRNEEAQEAVREGLELLQELIDAGH